MARQISYGSRPWTFYILLAFFTLFVIFLYGPMISVLMLSFQGENASLVFPLRDPSLMWFDELFNPRRTGDVVGAFDRSLPLALAVMVSTVLISVTAGFAFRRRFVGATFIFYVAIASLIVPGLVLSIGILVTFKYAGLSAAWYTSALGAHLSWALPFGLLIMFAILGRLNPSYEEAAFDLGASRWQTVKDVVVPIVFPGMIAVALFGFTLSYDEFPRSWLTAGSKNTLPLEIWTMTTNVTSPALYALGTVTTVVSLVVIALALGSIIVIQRGRSTK
ncbi:MULTISPECIES: ABC transporter permease [unclassified Mesorhizobium]|uniref:ABC transporter permease n=1 Tax=unclassified Mesorhizobium TaxID=325217 RepID=UPI000FDA1122|nr:MULTISPECIES: ABC transporter permease [unclassified Mesorhizobium]TGT71768.1 ABC transporter permease [Mesorhizobium sp. M2E.F.Ca.ET.166.01.1.1]TGV99518.1 ABC transporter permease [Mesorhizobium sp. M2E.F.Ca.ET.154.01.1.1]